MNQDHDVRRAAAAEYRIQIRRFARRGKIALVVRIVTSIVAVVMVGIGAVFVLSSITNVPGSHLAQRYIPGLDGSISIQTEGTYAVTNTEGPLPECTVADRDGTQLPLTEVTVEGNPPLPASLFDAPAGNYLVTCDGGAQQVTVYSYESIDIVQYRYLRLILQALPFLAAAAIAFWGGKYAANRIRPESMRPVIPN
ncbi:hypothetical protein [Tessaracoccus caeni]|uniref:hypothetical protein n=1 Tax=Tessaracoccus caeni TaxID=3031239 RepID=UPI0023DB85FB|nr:hypothetical protein [Tessaracoccus caeni]MDF1487881.1 hypothetical protein [Tessaracoccus caeni]